MTEPSKLIRIDLAETELPQPCERHAKRGYQPDCEECDEMDPQPAEIPELKGKFVEIRNPNLLPYGQTKELFAPKDDTETVAEFKERLAVALITAWNVVDAETGEELPLPSADRASLDRAVDVVTPVYAAVVKARKDRAVPKRTSSSS
jgi:hypothetical protein